MAPSIGACRWYRLKAGVPTVTGERLGRGTLHAHLAPAESYLPAGPLPSTPTFRPLGAGEWSAGCSRRRSCSTSRSTGRRTRSALTTTDNFGTLQEINSRENDTLAVVVEAARRSADPAVGDTRRAVRPNDAAFS